MITTSNYLYQIVYTDGTGERMMCKYFEVREDTIDFFVEEISHDAQGTPIERMTNRCASLHRHLVEKVERLEK